MPDRETRPEADDQDVDVDSNQTEIILALSIAALAAGPLIAGLLHREARLHALLDGFILVMVGGLALLHLLPHAYESIGAWAFLLAIAGGAIPYFTERRLEGHSHDGENPFFLWLAMLGLMLHASLDGAALAANATEHAEHLGQVGDETSVWALPLAIVLHRLPIGLLIWWSVKPKLGSRLAVALLLGVGAATLLGFALTGQLNPLSTGPALGVLTALLAGGLLHVVLDHHHHDDHCEEDRHYGFAAFGAALALGIFALLPESYPPVVRSAIDNVGSLLLESSFAIVLGFLGAGLLTMVPSKSLSRIMTGGNPFTSALRGIVVGLPLPICSCGVVPLYRGLHKGGVPAAAAMAFLVATPELGIDAVLISIPLLGVKLTIVRLIAAALVAMIAGVVAGMLTRNDPPAIEAATGTPMAGSAARSVAASSATGSEAGGATGDSTSPPETKAGGNSIRQALDFGLRESVDDLAPWIVTGIVVAAFVEPILKPALVAAVPAFAQVPVLGALATPVYICASGATPLAAVFLTKGITAGAVVAFLLTGPATNVTTFGALRSAHRLTVAVCLLFVVPVSAILLGWFINLIPGLMDQVPSTLGGAAERVAPYKVVGVVLFLFLIVDSIVRRGPRAFLRTVGIGRDEQAHPPADAPEGGGPAEGSGPATGSGSTTGSGPAETPTTQPEGA